jgi:2-methylcitrate dehydratase
LTVVARLARFVVARSWDDLSERAREELTIRVLDALGCALGANEAPPIRAIRAGLDDFGGRPLCTLIGGGRTAPDRAALYNGALVRWAPDAGLVYVHLLLRGLEQQAARSRIGGSDPEPT